MKDSKARINLQFQMGCPSVFQTMEVACYKDRPLSIEAKLLIILAMYNTMTDKDAPDLRPLTLKEDLLRADGRRIR